MSAAGGSVDSLGGQVFGHKAQGFSGGPAHDLRVVKEFEVPNLPRLVGFGGNLGRSEGGESLPKVAYEDKFTRMARIQAVTGAHVKIAMPDGSWGTPDTTFEERKLRRDQLKEPHKSGERRLGQRVPQHLAKAAPIVVKVTFHGRQDQIDKAMVMFEREMELERMRDDILHDRGRGHPISTMQSFYRLNAAADRERSLMLLEDYHGALLDCAGLANGEEAIRVLRLLGDQDINLRPTVDTFRLALRACVMQGSIAPALREAGNFERWGCSKKVMLEMLEEIVKHNKKLPCLIELVAEKQRVGMPLSQWSLEALSFGLIALPREVREAVQVVQRFREEAEAGANPMAPPPAQEGAVEVGTVEGSTEKVVVQLHDLARVVCLAANVSENPAVSLAAFQEWLACAKFAAPDAKTDEVDWGNPGYLPSKDYSKIGGREVNVPKSANSQFRFLASRAIEIAGMGRRLDLVQEMWKMVQASGFEASSKVTEQHLIALAVCGKNGTSLRLLPGHESVGKRANDFVHQVSMSAVSVVQAKYLLTTFISITESKEEVTPLMFALVLHALGRHDIRLAFEAFDRLYAKTFGERTASHPEEFTVVFNALLRAAGIARHWKAASLTKARMEQENVPLDAHSHAALVVAAIKTGELTAVQEHITAMGTEHHEFADAQKVRKLLRIVEDLKEKASKAKEAPKKEAVAENGSKDTEQVMEASKDTEHVTEAPKDTEQVVEASKGTEQVAEAPKDTEQVMEASKDSKSDEQVSEAPNGSNADAQNGSNAQGEAPKPVEGEGSLEQPVVTSRWGKA